MFFALVAFAAIGVGLGVQAGYVEVNGDSVMVQVVGCATEPVLRGRGIGSETTCLVTVGGRPTTVSTSARHPAGVDLRLLRSGGSYFDPVMTRDQLWWLPVGLLGGALAWWAGFPPRTDLDYGRHAAPRPR